MGANPNSEHGWTLAAYVAHNEAMREAEQHFLSERDRRYAEVKSANEKAFRVKDEADKAALSLAREIQIYKDEKANQLREQLKQEREDYALKTDMTSMMREFQAALKPLADHMASQAGGSKGMRDVWGWIVSAMLLVFMILNYFAPK